MREILFRGKRSGIIDHENDGEWAEGCYFEINGQSLIMTDDHRALAVDPSTVGQYTGLTDKNGKKIFEGDIVDITQYDNVYHKAYRCCRSIVFFSNFAFRTNAAPEYEDEEPLSYWLWHDCDFEVIGNVHDNPELLEDKP